MLKCKLYLKSLDYIDINRKFDQPLTTFKNIEESKQYVGKLDFELKLLKSIKLVLNDKGLNTYTLDQYIDKFESNTENLKGMIEKRQFVYTSQAKVNKNMLKNNKSSFSDYHICIKMMNRYYRPMSSFKDVNDCREHHLKCNVQICYLIWVKGELLKKNTQDDQLDLLLSRLKFYKLKLRELIENVLIHQARMEAGWKKHLFVEENLHYYKPSKQLNFTKIHHSQLSCGIIYVLSLLILIVCLLEEFNNEKSHRFPFILWIIFNLYSIWRKL